MNGVQAQTVDVASFYDARWSDERMQTLAGRRLERVAAILSEVAALRISDADILEIGCGTGSLSDILSYCGQVTATDIAQQTILRAQKVYPHVRFMAGDFFEIELPEQGFDLAVSQEVIEHIDDQPAFLGRIHALLRPGGYLILTTPNAWVFRYSGEFDRQLTGHGLQPTENHVTLRALRRMVSQQHFQVLRSYTICYGGHRNIFRVINSPRFSRLPGWRQLRSALRLGLHSVIVARKPAG